MSAPAPRASHEERRARILDAAAEAIVERGLAETRVADVAMRARMSPGHVLYYFGTKDELLLEALRRSEEGLYEEVAADLATIPGPVERLVRLIEHSSPAGKGDPAWVLWVEVWARAARDEALAKQLGELDQRWLDTLVEIVREGQQTGVFDASVDADDFADGFTALLDGLAVAVVLGSQGTERPWMLQTAIGQAAAELGFKVPSRKRR
ncbi:MAG: TetR/AcrR family transcriptional regulator [Actinomycetota bacterium]